MEKQGPARWGTGRFIDQTPAHPAGASNLGPGDNFLAHQTNEAALCLLYRRLSPAARLTHAVHALFALSITEIPPCLVSWWLARKIRDKTHVTQRT